LSVITYLIDQKQCESFIMLCWETTEKISWTDGVKNVEV